MDCIMGKLFSKSRRDHHKHHHKNHRSNAYAVHQAEDMPSTSPVRFEPAHSEPVDCVATVNSNICFSGAKDQTAAVFDHSKGNLLQRWTGHEGDVMKVVYGSAIDAYFTASRDKTVCMWRRGQNEPINTFVGHSLVVMGLTISPDNTQICSGSRDNSMRLWSVETGQCVMQNSISRNLITQVKWSPDGSFIAQSGEDKEVRVFDARSLQLRSVFPKKQYIQTWVDVSPDSNYLLTSSNGFGGQGCEATLWDVRATKAVCEYRGHHETTCCAVFLPPSFGPDLLATSSSDSSVRIWDRNSKDTIDVLSLAGSGPLTSIAPHDDSGFVVSSFKMGLIKVMFDNGRMHITANF